VTDYPAMPPAEPVPVAAGPPPGPRPRLLRYLVVLLFVNLAFSIGLTIAVFVLRKSVVDFQVAHTALHANSDRSIADQRRILRRAANIAIWSRVGGSLIVAIVYGFLVRALLRGSRRAYQRVVLIGALGLVSLVLLWLRPYPTWMRIEQLAQGIVLLSILFCVTRPEIRAHFAPRPGAKWWHLAPRRRPHP
jgi:hypothetical protein